MQATFFKRQANHEYPAAILSPCKTYRYVLVRGCGHGTGYANFIMLNPSTADAHNDDPTIRRCIGFVRDWGYADLIVTNLFAFRSTDPKALKTAADPVGPDYDRYLVEVASKALVVVAAWGNHGTLRGRNAEVIRMLAEVGVKPRCLAISAASGQPSHPLYLPASLTPREFEGGQGR